MVKDGVPMQSYDWGHHPANEQPIEHEASVEREILKVSAKSQPNMVAGAIAGLIRSDRHVQLQAIGAGAVNQTVKSVATARNYLLADGIDIICTPSFVEVDLDGRIRTAISMIVEPR